MDSIRDLLKRLTTANVEFVVVGGVAAILHGAPVGTWDVDLCIPLTEENAARLLRALDGLHPRWRSHPAHPPLDPDPRVVAGYRNLYLQTDLADADFLGQISGIGGYAEVVAVSEAMVLDGDEIRVLTLNALITAKHAAGREKDKIMLIQLEAIRRKLEARGRGE